jgi:hypothetical protein
LDNTFVGNSLDTFRPCDIDGRKSKGSFQSAGEKLFLYPPGYILKSSHSCGNDFVGESSFRNLPGYFSCLAENYDLAGYSSGAKIRN